MKMRTLVDTRRLASRTARIGTVRSKGVRSRTTVPSLSSATKSHAARLGNPQGFQDTHPHLRHLFTAMRRRDPLAPLNASGEELGVKSFAKGCLERVELQTTMDMIRRSIPR